MKFQTEDPQFRPVVITLESQDEVDWMAAVLGRVVSSHLLNDFNFNLYNRLNGVASIRRPFKAEGTIKMKEERG